jgi:hypothetical protein
LNQEIFEPLFGHILNWIFDWLLKLSCASKVMAWSEILVPTPGGAEQRLEEDGREFGQI